MNARSSPVPVLLAVLAALFEPSCRRDFPPPPLRVSPPRMVRHVGPKDEERTPGQALALGKERASRGEDGLDLFREAADGFTELLRGEPDKARLLLGRAEALQELGDALDGKRSDPRETFKRAKEDMDRLIRKDRRRAEAFFRRGELNLRLGDLEMGNPAESRRFHSEAVADYKKAGELGMDPSRFELHMGIAFNAVGTASLQTGEDGRPSFQQAVSIFSAFLKRDPDSAEAYTHRGYAFSSLAAGLQMRGQDAQWAVDRALSDCSEAIQRDPDRSAPYFTRGRLHAFSGRIEDEAGRDPRRFFKEAIEDFSRALDRNPRFLEAWLNRGMTRRVMGFSPEALGDFEKALELADGEAPDIEGQIRDLRYEAGLPAWARALIRAEHLVRWGARQEARSIYEAAFPGFEGKVDVKELKLDGLVILAHMHLARIYSLASDGKLGQGSPPLALTEKEKGALLGKALLQLRKSLQLGYNQFSFIRRDPELAAVRALPEFESLLAEFGGKGK